jgi:hypothetical protein
LSADRATFVFQRPLRTQANDFIRAAQALVDRSGRIGSETRIHRLGEEVPAEGCTEEG